MNGLLPALIARSAPIERELWRTWWERLAMGRVPRGEAAAVLASLSTAMPDLTTIAELLSSFEPRSVPDGSARVLRAAVNIVGTGGGPRTFNISTAAAIVAAAMGVRVVKTGSGSYQSACGSYDVLGHLGVPLTSGYDETAESLERHGIAFAGPFVYPAELSRLAAATVPVDFRTVARFVNSIGPFLAAMPTATQLTGVSDRSLLPTMRFLADREPRRRVWICANALGADELLAFSRNVVYPNRGAAPIRLSPEAFGIGGGRMADLAPATGSAAVVEHLLGVLAGRGAPAAVRTVCLNAAAMAVATGYSGSWQAGLDAAMDAVGSGAALDVVDRLRRTAPRPGQVVCHA